jgi:hypothetical protein
MLVVARDDDFDAVVEPKEQHWLSAPWSLSLIFDSDRAELAVFVANCGSCLNYCLEQSDDCLALHALMTERYYWSNWIEQNC